MTEPNDDIFGEPEEEQVEAQAEGEVQPEGAEDVEATASTETSTEIEAKVPLNALNEARMETRQTKQELAQVRQQMEQLQAMRGELDEWRKSQQTQTQQQDEDRFNTDPLGALRDDVRETKEMIETRDQQAGAQEQQQREIQTVITQAGQMAKQFAEDTPDYGDAFTHYMDTRRQELAIYGLDDATIQNTLDNEAYSLSADALSKGRNPAEIIYGLAQTRGYSKAVAPEAKETKIENIEKGQQASQSLANTQGESEGVGLQDISKMSDEEFDKYWDTMEQENRQ